jgi:flagellar protein FlgJ
MSDEIKIGPLPAKPVFAAHAAAADADKLAVKHTEVKNAEVENAAQQFESLLLSQMLKSMWQTVPDGGMLSGSREEEIYRDMLSDAMGDEIAKGQGIGVKGVLAKELYKREKL